MMGRPGKTPPTPPPVGLPGVATGGGAGVTLVVLGVVVVVLLDDLTPPQPTAKARTVAPLHNTIALLGSDLIGLPLLLR